MAKIRIGLLGGGRIGRLHGTNLQNSVPDAEVIMLADPFLNDDMAAWAESIGIPACTKDADEVFANPDVDAVFICSSTNTHAEFIIKAAKAGKDIFCEKPIATEIPDIKEAIAAVEEAGVKLQVGFVRRFDHNHKAVRDVVASMTPELSCRIRERYGAPLLVVPFLTSLISSGCSSLSFSQKSLIFFICPLHSIQNADRISTGESLLDAGFVNACFQFGTSVFAAVSASCLFDLLHQIRLFQRTHACKVQLMNNRIGHFNRESMLNKLGADEIGTLAAGSTLM